MLLPDDAPSHTDASRAVDWLPKPTEADLKAYYEPAVWKRGQAIFEQGRIRDVAVQGMRLFGRCNNSNARRKPYAVSARFDRTALRTVSCPCPEGRERPCEHTAALLLHYVHQLPVSITPEQAQLAAMSSEELWDLVDNFLFQDPTLVCLFPLTGLPDPKAGPADEETLRAVINLAIKRRVIDSELRGYGLTELDLLGRAYLTQGDPVSAARLSGLIAQTLLATSANARFVGESWKPAWEVYLAVFWNQLEGIKEPEARAALLPLLVPICTLAQSYNYRGKDQMVLEAIQSHLRPDEIKQMAGLVEARLKQPLTHPHKNEYDALLHLSLKLDRGAMPLEIFIERALRTSQYEEIIPRLVAEGQIERLAETLVRAGRGAVGAMLTHVLEHGQGNRLIGAVERGLPLDLWPCIEKGSIPGNENLAETVALAELKRQPDSWNYHYWRSSLERHRLWDRLRPRFEVQLEALERYDALIELALEDGNIEAALRWVDRLPGRDPFGRASELRRQVADDAVRDYPQEALVLYAEEAETLIAGRNRMKYQSAAELLLVMRDIYTRLGQRDTFEAYLAALRVEYQRLSALQQELTSAGL
jgi:hypothetical protein